MALLGGDRRPGRGEPSKATGRHPNVRSSGKSSHSVLVCKSTQLSSRPEDFHLRALPEPYVNLSIHTAPDVRPLPWHSCQ